MASSGSVNRLAEASAVVVLSGVGRNHCAHGRGRTRATGAAISGSATTKDLAKAATSRGVSRRLRPHYMTRASTASRRPVPISGRPAGESGAGCGLAAVSGDAAACGGVRQRGGGASVATTCRADRLCRSGSSGAESSGPTHGRRASKGGLRPSTAGSVCLPNAGREREGRASAARGVRACRTGRHATCKSGQRLSPTTYGLCRGRHQVERISGRRKREGDNR